MLGNVQSLDAQERDLVAKARRLRNNWAHNAHLNDAQLEREMGEVRSCIRPTSSFAGADGAASGGGNQQEGEGTIFGSVMKGCLAWRWWERLHTWRRKLHASVARFAHVAPSRDGSVRAQQKAVPVPKR